MLDKFAVGTVLIRKGSPLAVLLASQPDWELAFEGDSEQLFVRHSLTPPARDVR